MRNIRVYHQVWPDFTLPTFLNEKAVERYYEACLPERVLVRQLNEMCELQTQSIRSIRVNQSDECDVHPSGEILQRERPARYQNDILFHSRFLLYGSYVRRLNRSSAVWASRRRNME